MKEACIHVGGPCEDVPICMADAECDNVAVRTAYYSGGTLVCAEHGQVAPGGDSLRDCCAYTHAYCATEEEVHRVSGDALCPECSKPYRKHPTATGYLDWEGNPWAHRACDGRLIKL